VFRYEFWQGRRDSNPRPTVLETAALPAELRPYPHKRGRQRPQVSVYQPGPRALTAGCLLTLHSA
jgi:hypothetical protein